MYINKWNGEMKKPQRISSPIIYDLASTIETLTLNYFSNLTFPCDL